MIECLEGNLVQCRFLEGKWCQFCADVMSYWHSPSYFIFSEFRRTSFMTTLSVHLEMNLKTSLLILSQALSQALSQTSLTTSLTTTLGASNFSILSLRLLIVSFRPSIVLWRLPITFDWSFIVYRLSFNRLLGSFQFYRVNLKRRPTKPLAPHTARAPAHY